jgi:hypothetical protein
MLLATSPGLEDIPDVHTIGGPVRPMKRFARLELAVALAALILGMLGYLLQSSTLDFFAVVSGALALRWSLREDFFRRSAEG